MLQEARDVGVIIKYYPDGSLFVIMFSDGTGTVYYPSGRIAITISAVGKHRPPLGFDIDWSIAAKILY